MKNIEDYLVCHQDDLLTMAKRITNTNPTYDPHDLVSETCLRIITQKDKFVSNTENGFKRWSYVVMRSIFLNQITKIQRRQKILTQNPIINDNHTNFKCDIDNIQLNEFINNNLPQELQSYFKLHLLGYNAHDISKKLKVKKTQVYNNIKKCKVILTDKFSKEDIRNFDF